MFRSKLNETSVQYPLGDYYPCPQMNILPNPAHFRPNFDVNGSQTCFNSFHVGQVPLQPQHFSNTYPNYHRPPPHPMFQPNNWPTNRPIFLPFNTIHQDVQMPTKFVLEAPIMPRDPEMLKNIDLLSSFVIKNGLSFERMIKEKQANDPKFGFLFESEPGTEAAIGRIYYEWKKNALQATFHPQHEFQALPYLSNHCSNFMIEDFQKETCNPLGQGHFSSTEIDMEIEDENEEPISIHTSKSENVEELKNESIANTNSIPNSTLALTYETNRKVCAMEESLIPNNLNHLGNDVTFLSNPHEVLVLNKPSTIITCCEENFCRQGHTPFETKEKIESNDLDKIILSTKEVHQICDSDEEEDIMEVTPTCSGETFHQPILTKRKNALVDVPYKQSSEIGYKKTLESFEKTNEIDDGIEAKIDIIFEQDDAFEKDTIEEMGCVKEEDLSNVNEEENNCSPKLKRLGEVVANQPLVLTNINLHTSIESVKFEFKDFQSNASNKESNCSLRPKESYEVVANQPLVLETTNINPHIDIETINSSMVLNHLASDPLVDSKPMPKVLDEFGRIMKQGASDSDDENIHYIDGNKNINIKCLRTSTSLPVTYNCRLRSPSSNPSLQPHSKQKHRYSSKYQQKQNMSPTKDFNHNNNLMKEYDRGYQNANDYEGVKRRRSGKCVYYAQGRCRRGNRCWYKHSNSENGAKYNRKYDKELYQNDDQLKQQNLQDASEENNNNYSNCDLTYGEGTQICGRKNEHDISSEKNIDYSKVQSKSLDDHGYKKSKTCLKHEFVDKSYKSDSIKCNVKIDKEIDQISGKDERESWQQDIEEKSSSYNGCSYSCEDAKTLQEKNDEELSYEKNINHSEGLSNDGGYREIETYLKHDEYAIKPIESKEEQECELKERKSQLTNTATSSDHLSALSSTASLDHIQEISSLVESPLTQISTQPQKPQASNLTTSIVNNQTKVLSINLLKDACDNISNSTSLNVFIPKQASLQTTTLPPPSNHPHMLYSTSLLNKTPDIASSRSYNIPPTQYQQIFEPISKNHGIWHNSFMEPSPPLNTTSTTQPTNQSILSFLTNSQQSLQNMKCVSSSLLQNDCNMNKKYSPQPPTFDYPYHQTSILNESSQQQHYFNNSLPQQFIHSSQIQNGCQSQSKGPSSTRVMQYKDGSCIVPLPPPPLTWPSPLAPTTMIYSIRPTQVATLQQSYAIPPPPPPPSLKKFHSKEYNILQSYPSPQIYDSLQKQYIESEPLTNYSYKVTSSYSKADTMLPLPRLEMSKHDLLQSHNLETPTFENVSPAGEGGQSWIAVDGDEIIEGIANTKHEQKKKINKEDQPKIRGLTLLRTKVAEYVREILKPKWREGIMSKEAFKTITKKVVDKVIGTVKPHHVPNTTEKVASYMMAARPKILKLVQGYVDKYVRD